MKIVIDAMGGDFAPESVIEGTAEALNLYKGFGIVLVGNLETLKPYIDKHGLEDNPRVELVNADQVVQMDDPSTSALRGKKNSSITVGAGLVAKEDAGDAIVTVGNTGAAVAATTVKMKTLPGVERPAIAVIMPTKEGQVVLIDGGANVDCKPKNLAQFAVMGELYSQLVLGVNNPRIGLLNVGDEAVKGNETTKEAHKIISGMPVNFVGNVEGTDIFDDKTDVVVCDGFVGNAILKSGEGLSKAAMHWMKKIFTKTPFRKMTGLLAKNAFYELKQIGDSEEYGGAPLLGVNGICIIGHGSSSHKAVSNAIKVAGKMVRQDLNGGILNRLKESNIIMKNK